MDSAVIETLAAEAEAAAIPVAAVREGLEDYLSLDLRQDTRAEVDALLVEVRRRGELLSALKSALATTRAAIEALLADGHPALWTREVVPEVLVDLDQNLLSLSAAHGRFLARPLTTGGVLEIGPETPA
ncbi:MAG: hypothetical protein ACREXU_18900 [Gammaproteobacteria bacterium]